MAVTLSEPPAHRPFPIQSLANEILSNVFLQGARSHRNSRPNVFRSVVSLVCRHWHATAVRTPQLWVHILWRPNGENEMDMNLEAVARHLQRSGGLSLDVDIDFTTAPDISEEKFTALMDVLRLHIHRARTMTLSCRGMGNTLFPRPEDNNNQSPIPFGPLQKLRRLQIVGMLRFDADFPFLDQIEPRQLRILDIMRCRLDQSSLHNFLQRCDKLSTLRMKAGVLRDDSVIPETDLLLPSVHTLEIVLVHHGRIGLFARGYSSDPLAFNPPAVASSVLPIMPNLHSLAIHSDADVSMLGAPPNIREITLQRMARIAEFLSQFLDDTPHDDSPDEYNPSAFIECPAKVRLLPDLEYITIHINMDSVETMDTKRDWEELPWVIESLLTERSELCVELVVHDDGGAVGRKHAFVQECARMFGDYGGRGAIEIKR